MKTLFHQVLIYVLTFGITDLFRLSYEANLKGFGFCLLSRKLCFF